MDEPKLYDDQFLTEKEHDMFRTGVQTLRFIVDNSEHKREMALLLTSVASSMLQAVDETGTIQGKVPIDIIFDPEDTFENNVRKLIRELQIHDKSIDGSKYLPDGYHVTAGKAV